MEQLRRQSFQNNRTDRQFVINMMVIGSREHIGQEVNRTSRNVMVQFGHMDNGGLLSTVISNFKFIVDIGMFGQNCLGTMKLWAQFL